MTALVAGLLVGGRDARVAARPRPRHHGEPVPTTPAPGLRSPAQILAEPLEQAPARQALGQPITKITSTTRTGQPPTAAHSQQHV